MKENAVVWDGYESYILHKLIYSALLGEKILNFAEETSREKRRIL